jgi:sugar phosphate isomerase/epimerase
MRYGVCAGPERADVLAQAGYDFIELSVAGHLMTEEDDIAWLRTTGERLKSLPLPPETFNSFIRADKIVGPDVDTGRLRQYIKSACLRAASIGGKIIVFGSGGMRHIPDGFDPDMAREQLYRFLEVYCDAAFVTNLIVAIEPLQRAESNSINLVGEAAQIARDLSLSHIRVLGDTFHMERENEPLSALVAARDVLAHVHVADTGRRAPGTGTYDYVSLFGALRAANYDKRVSIECSWGDDFDGEAVRALAVLKAAHAAANNGNLETTQEGSCEGS